MPIEASYYDLLGVPETASADQIKAAFKRIALSEHPDRHGNSKESNDFFILLSNAYTNLVEAKKRKRYDAFLYTSKHAQSRASAKARSNRKTAEHRADAVIKIELNTILWDIEDLVETTILSKSEKRTILEILTSIDKWILSPNGYPDYFMDARRMKRSDPEVLIETLLDRHESQSHVPYVDIKDYFWTLRKRSNGFLAKLDLLVFSDLIPGTSIRKIDAILETQNKAFALLGKMQKTEVRPLPRR